MPNLSKLQQRNLQRLRQSGGRPQKSVRRQSSGQQQQQSYGYGFRSSGYGSSGGYGSGYGRGRCGGIGNCCIPKCNSCCPPVPTPPTPPVAFSGFYTAAPVVTVSPGTGTTLVGVTSASLYQVIGSSPQTVTTDAAFTISNTSGATITAAPFTFTFSIPYGLTTITPSPVGQAFLGPQGATNTVTVGTATVSGTTVTVLLNTGVFLTATTVPITVHLDYRTV